MLTHNARVVRWAGPAFVLFSLILLPWMSHGEKDMRATYLASGPKAPGYVSLR